MSWLHFIPSLNPKNSLFGRIFVWFWSAIIIMVVLAFITARYFSHTWEISAADDRQISQAKRVLSNVTKLIENKVHIERAMRRVGMRSNLHIMSVDPAKGRFEFGFPPTFVKNRDKFLELRDEQTPFLIRTGNMELIGPILLETRQRTLQFYVGKLLRREQRPAYVIGAALGIMLLVGTLACLVISWNLAKPIKQLSQLSKRLATDSSTQANINLQSRKDEIGQLHKDVFDMANKLAESLTKQKELMANISHELRTPLTRLQLAIAMIKPTEEQVNYANRIEKDISIMDALIAQALQLAKLNNDKDNSFVLTEQSDLKKVISPLYEDLQFEAKAKNVELEINQYPNVTLLVHKVAFISALENIIRNAINYCRSKVQINLQVQSNDKNDQYLAIDIDDDGKGVEEKNMALLFSPFFRAHQNLEQKGTGLGLTIAKTAIERHNGNIDISKSALGGLRVRVSIPIVTSQE